MKSFIQSEKTPLIVISAIYLITFIITYACYGDLFIDCGREAYIPHAILQNKLLYKDIFCIYGPFPYLFEAFFYKIFGSNLNIIYFTGFILGALYTMGTYMISRTFLSKALSALICILIIFSTIFDPTLFNFILPYSLAMVFAATCAIWILVFLIKYIKTKNGIFLNYCAILWGTICVSKIDFIPTIIIIAAIFLIVEENKKQKLIDFIKYSLIIPAITYLILFTQGVAITDIIKNSHYVSQMMNTDAFYFFYSNTSIVFFKWAVFIDNLKNLLLTATISLIYFSVMLFALRRRNRYLKYGLAIFIFIFCLFIFMLQQTMLQMLFTTLPYICTIIFVIYVIKYKKAKEYKRTSNLITLTLYSYAIICSLKSYHALLLSFYGTYCFAFLLIATVVYINELLKNNAIFNTKKQYETVLCAYLLIFSLLFAQQLALHTFRDNLTIKTKYGKIKSNVEIAQPFSETLQYINNHTSAQDTLLVMPESIMLNFLSGRKSQFYQTSFIPLDFETFKEDNIINEIAYKKPKYIVITNRKTNEYGKAYICRDYGVKTCKYVVNNYSLEAAFGEKFRMYIFKYKEPENEEK